MHFWLCVDVFSPSFKFLSLTILHWKLYFFVFFSRGGEEGQGRRQGGAEGAAAPPPRVKRQKGREGERKRERKKTEKGERNQKKKEVELVFPRTCGHGPPAAPRPRP